MQRRCGNSDIGRDRPTHSTDVPRLLCRGGFLALSAKRTGTAVGHPSRRDQAHRTIARRSALVQREGRISRTASGAIGVRQNIGSRTSFREGSMGPVRGPRHRRLSHHRRSTLHHAHGGRREVWSPFHTQIPHPRRHALPAVLPTRRTSNPTVRVVLVIVVREDHLTRPAMQRQVEYI